MPAIAMLAAIAFTVPAKAQKQAAPQYAFAAGPVLRLAAAQQDITISDVAGQPVSVDPGIWLENLGTSFQLDIRRPGARQPVTVTEVLAGPDGTVKSRTLPSAILAGWVGLNNFLTVTVKDSHGRTVASAPDTFCPNSADPQRIGPSSPPASPYPEVCGFNPFQVSAVWGIEQDWAVDPAQAAWPTFILSPGAYEVTEAISPSFRKIFGIPDAYATATVDVTLTSATAGPAVGGRPGKTAPSFNHEAGAIGQLSGSAGSPPAAQESHLPASVLPDLSAAPAWGIMASNSGGRDLLDFSATISNEGNAPLDVEGFRSGESTVMAAYQYFHDGGRVVGYDSAGTMGFDSRPGHDHWHFQQFAEYNLLNATGKTVLRSQKVGFCIAPTDAMDLLLRHATWQPGSIGLGGECGVPTTLWVEEYLPPGWGDSYSQSLPGQAFDITDLPNGVYNIQIVANPLHELHELTLANNTSLRKVVLGGKPGARTVCASAVDGIDPEC